jgi:hypothetical protein
MNYFATDYMLGTIFFLYCLLFINTFYLEKLVFTLKELIPLDVSKNNILLNSQNNSTRGLIKPDIQSAEN